MADDAKWLSDYVEHRSEEAFRKLVEHYLTLVYSAALRRLGGDAHLAKDVAQQVFSDLARKAGRISREAPLGGWLHRHTCFVAASVLRAERRRKLRENQALLTTMNQSQRESKWDDIAHLLDAAIDRLGTADRTAIVLRFLERRDLRSIGASLGISEDAAQKRVARALEKLRVILGRGGVSLCAAALGTTLATQTGSAVPLGLAAAISTTALGTTTTAASTLTTLMIMTKLKLALAAVVVAGVSTIIIVQQQGNAGLRAQVQALRQQLQDTQEARDQSQATTQRTLDEEEQQRLKDLQAELMRLRSQASAFRQREEELAQTRAELRRLLSAGAVPGGGQRAVPSSPAEPLKAAADWNNAGLATPASAYETWNWAKAKRDADALAGTLVLDADARVKAEALLASLPEAVRAKYGTVERMMATMQMNTKPIAAAQVVSQDQVGADDVLVHTRWQDADGMLGENDWALHREADGWRMRIPVGLVDKMEKGLRLGGLTTAESSQP
jgi:RNA polymerase sigma factor (sigma-70 family)